MGKRDVVGSLAVLLTVFAAACATSRSAATEDPRGTLDAFVAALNHADVDAMMRLFAPDATAFLPVDSSPRELVGAEAIRGVFEPLFRDIREGKSGPDYMHIVPKDVHVQRSGEAAVVTFDAGSGPVTSRRTLVMSESPGGWRIVHFHGSNVRISSGPLP